MGQLKAETMKKHMGKFQVPLTMGESVDLRALIVVTKVLAKSTAIIDDTNIGIGKAMVRGNAVGRDGADIDGMEQVTGTLVKEEGKMTVYSGILRAAGTMIDLPRRACIATTMHLSVKRVLVVVVDEGVSRSAEHSSDRVSLACKREKKACQVIWTMDDEEEEEGLKLQLEARRESVLELRPRLLLPLQVGDLTPMTTT
jgi:hypothetical protein